MGPEDRQTSSRQDQRHVLLTMESWSSNKPTSPAPQLKRKRTSFACDSCRLRKVRCDGRQPCSTCSGSNENCLYGVDVAQRSRTELILDVTLRSEQLLHDIQSTLTSMVRGGVLHHSDQTPVSPQGQLSYTVDNNTQEGISPIDNATLAPLHSSNTESILRWHLFDNVPLLRGRSSFSVFEMEYTRPPLSSLASVMCPYAGDDKVNQIINAFQKSVNSWYPVIAFENILDIRRKVVQGELDNDIQSCLALLVMALGSAAELVFSICQDDLVDHDIVNSESQAKALAQRYFDTAMRSFHIVSETLAIKSVQCLFLAGLYYAFLQRPLQAWHYINSAATKCRLLLAYDLPNASREDEEITKRIFWSCYILESDYIAELSALPQSGISEIESTVSLPGNFHTHENFQDEQDSSLYFLACISMRRLLNRVHHLLYAPGSHASFDSGQLPTIVAELDHQLEEWHDVIPQPFQFTVSSLPCETQQAAFLRQRYLTCRSVIYRPYLIWALEHVPSSAANTNLASTEWKNCKICLDSCILHISNLGNYAHTIMVDTWICSLSMAAAMLTLLAACKNTTVHQLVSSKINTLGPHLERLLSSWMHIPGRHISPSICQSLNLISTVTELIREAFPDTSNRQGN